MVSKWNIWQFHTWTNRKNKLIRTDEERGEEEGEESSEESLKDCFQNAENIDIQILIEGINLEKSVNQVQSKSNRY